MTIDEAKNVIYKYISFSQENMNLLVALKTLLKDYDNGYTEAYNKAIDDAMEKSAKAICIGCGYLDGTSCKYTGCNCGVSKPMLETVMKALEQLKEGGENEERTGNT